jgi:hypothetical protein
MKIETFAGVFQFNGAERRFALEGDALRIGPLSVNEASGLLSAIEDREGVQPAEPVKVKAEPVELAGGTKAAGRVKKPAEARPEPVKAEPPRQVELPKVEPVKAEPEPADEAEIPFGKPEAEASPDNGGGVAETVKAGDAAGRLDLSAAKRLADVISALQEQGITDAEALIAECERLRPEVPLLARIPDMRDRVERTLATLGQ